VVQPLRAGLIGLGSMGRNHARILASLDEVEFVGVADPAGDPHAVARGIPVFTSNESLLNAGLDYCVVASPTATHEETATELAAAGIHMLVEKPVSVDVASARRLVELYESAGLVGAVGHIERYNPALQQLKSRVQSGDLGDIYQVATRRQGPFPVRISDVGVVKDLATHDIDSTAFVTGSDFVAISARTAHKTGRAHEDLVAATGVLANDTITNHLVNWLSPLKERLTIVTGDKGTFIADTLTGDLTFHANGTLVLEWSDVSHFRGMTEGDVIRYAFAKPEPLRTEHLAFRDAVQGRDAEIVTLRQGLTAVAVAEAVLESASIGSTVPIAPVDA